MFGLQIHLTSVEHCRSCISDAVMLVLAVLFIVVREMLILNFLIDKVTLILDVLMLVLSS